MKLAVLTITRNWKDEIDYMSRNQLLTVAAKLISVTEGE